MKYFLAVADCKSFSEAAEQCYISQSAISQQIKALEDELGIALIQRSNRRFLLTEAGEYFYAHAQTMLQSVDELKAGLAEIKAKEHRVFRLGCDAWFPMGAMYQAVNSVLAENSNAEITISFHTHEDALEMLHHGQLDMFLGDLRSADEENDFSYRGLTKTNLGVIIPARSELAAQETLAPEDLAELPCVLPEDVMSVNDWKKFRSLYGFADNRITPPSLRAAIARLITDGGYLLLPHRLGLPNEYAGCLQLLPLASSSAAITLNQGAFWHPQNTPFHIKEVRSQLLANLSDMLMDA